MAAQIPASKINFKKGQQQATKDSKNVITLRASAGTQKAINGKDSKTKESRQS